MRLTYPAFRAGLCKSRRKALRFSHPEARLLKLHHHAKSKQISGYNVFEASVYFGTVFAISVGGHTGGACPLQDKKGAVI